MHSSAIVAVSACPDGYDYVQSGIELGHMRSWIEKVGLQFYYSPRAQSQVYI